MQALKERGGPRSAHKLICGSALVMFSIACGFFQVYGEAVFAGNGFMDEGWTALLPRAVLASALFGCAMLTIGHLVEHLRGKRAECEPRRQGASQQRIPLLVPQWKGKSVLLFGSIIFLAWLPWGISMYPASMNWDTFYQIWQWYPESHPLLFIPWAPTGSFIDNAFTDHHPIFDTLVFGAFARASDLLFGNWNAGVFAFVLIQAFGMAASLSACIAYARRKGCPIPVCFGCLIFVCLVPLFPVYAFTMLKDAFFAWLFIPWFLMVVAICTERGAPLASPRFCTAFIVLCVLLCLAKKTGLYIVAPSAVVLALAFRAHWRPLALSVAAMLVVMKLVLPLVVFPLADVAPGGKQEMLAPLFQQTARYVIEHPDEVTPSEQAAIDAVLGYERLAQEYEPLTSDPIKNGFNWNATSDELKAYFRAWGSEGARHPLTYLKATFAVSSRYLCLAGNVAPDFYLADKDHDGTGALWHPASLEEMRVTMEGLYAALMEAPVLNLPLKAVVYALWLPLMGLYLMLREKSPYLPIYLPLLLSLAACIIGPVFQARYMIAMAYVAPLLVCTFFMQWGPRKKEPIRT